jgi:hypothetical protein
VDHQLVETETHIKYDNLLSAADGGHVPSDFVVSTYGDNFYFHCFSPVFVYRLLIAAGKNPGVLFSVTPQDPADPHLRPSERTENRSEG